MSDVIQGNNFKQLTAAGTTLFTDRNCAIRALTVLGTGNGTILFYNSPSIAGTSSGNQLVALNLTSPTVPQTLLLNALFSDGLVAVVTGTVSVGVSWS